MKTNSNAFLIGPIAHLADSPSDESPQEPKKLYLLDNFNEFAIDFFKCSTDGKTSSITGIFRVGVTDYLLSKGIYKRLINGELNIIQEKDSVITLLQLHHIYEIFENYFEEQGDYYNYNDGNIQITSPLKTIILKEIYLNSKDQIINKNLIHSLSEHKKSVLSDTKEEAFFVFNNGIIAVNSLGYRFTSYKDALQDKCIFSSSIINHNLVYTEDYLKADYSLFINNVFKDQADAARSSIGYLLHKSNNQSNMPIVIMYDEAITSKNAPEGRTGKGLFAEALSKVSALERIDGKRIQPDKFSFEKVTSDTKIVFIDDARKDFDIDSLNSSSTEGLSFNRKFKSEIYFTKETTPKILISSNHILATEGKTRAHRQYILEFSDYYSSRITSSSTTPVKDVHGRIFFEEWDEAEWNRFYSFMIDSTKLYLQNGLIAPTLKNVHENRLRQTTSEEVLDWIKVQAWEINKEYNSKALHESFFQESNFETTLRNFTDTVKKYAASKGWNYINQGHSKFKFSMN